VSQLHFPAGAVWIGSDHPFDLNEAYLRFRSPAGWRLARKPAQATLFITADSRYKLWVNGQFVARGPARSYPENQAVDALDITAYLQTGPNRLAVHVYQPGYSHFSYLHRGAAGLLAYLVCDKQSTLVTDLSWRTRRDPSFAAQVPRVSIYGTGVEERDLNLVDDWTAPDYDDTGWAIPRVVAPVGGYPWLSLQPRDLPLLVEREIPLTLRETRRGKTPTSQPTDAHLTLREGWLGAKPEPHPLPDLKEGGEPHPRPLPDLKEGGRKSSLPEGESFSSLTPLPEVGEGVGMGSAWLTATLAPGESAYWLFDLGQDYSCQGWAEISNASGQEQLYISYQEKIRQGELVICDPQTYCRVRLTDRFRLRSGPQQAESFALRGGRYLIFGIAGPTGPNFQFRPHVRISEYPLEIERPLSTSDSRLEAVIALCENTFRACLQDGFVDCTWRESSQWLGDALPQSLIMASLNDDTRPLRQVIEMAAQGAYPDGVLPSVLPGEVHAYTVVDYNFIWVELLRLYHHLTGDEEFVKRMWPTLTKMLDRFHQDLNPAGLIKSQPGRRLFLDWAPLSRHEPNAIYNLSYLLALQAASKMTDDQNFVLRANQLQKNIRAAFWQNQRWYDDLERTTFSQLAASLAILTETTTLDEVDPLLEVIIARSLGLEDGPAPDKMVLASPFMHHYIFEALRRYRKFEAVLEIIRYRLGRWAQTGYPTTWENWDVDFPDGSQCHAFSAHPRYHLAQIAQALGDL
jgi:hypothetical protein